MRMALIAIFCVYTSAAFDVVVVIDVKGEEKQYKITGLNPDSSVHLLREKVAKELRVAEDQVDLFYGNDELFNKYSLADYDINAGSTITAETN
ncbi:hypothetical protein JTB14_018060 [Gonioctena quinquepunctata]|nr:hypothetical protein JTB14_018060 [Gonioctena quinquepunctata]